MLQLVSGHAWQTGAEEVVASDATYCAEAQPGGNDDDTHVPLLVNTKLALQSLHRCCPANEHVKQFGSGQLKHMGDVEAVAFAEMYGALEQDGGLDAEMHEPVELSR